MPIALLRLIVLHNRAMVRRADDEALHGRQSVHAWQAHVKYQQIRSLFRSNRDSLFSR